MKLTLARSPSPSDGVDPRDLDAVYGAFHAFVLRLCLRMNAGDLQWAEDVTQDVFLQLHEQPGLLDDVRNIEAWLTTVTTRRCLARLRRDRFLRVAPIRWLLRESVREAKSPEAQGIVDDALRRTVRAVQAQSPKVRAAFFLYYVDQMTVCEIAEVLGHSKGYVSKLLARARQAVDTEDLP